jgi:hypothetical protein
MDSGECMDAGYTGSKRHRSICPNGATHISPMERDARGGHERGIGNVIVRFATTGQRISAQWNGMPGEGMNTGSETSSFDLPQRGNAYQPNGTGCPGSAWPRDRKRHRSICPNGATHISPMERDARGGHEHGIGNVIVRFAPTGQRIPAQGANPGNCIRENRCVLKEHRIGWLGGDVRDTEICGVPSERGSVLTGGNA